MKRMLLYLMLIVLSGCDIAFGPEPTATPTPNFAPLVASPTFDIHPPTELPPGVYTGMEGVNNATAAAVAALSPISPAQPTVDPAERPILITVPLPSGEQLNGELWIASTISPGVLLVGGTFESWSGFPATLRQMGYTTVTVEGGTTAPGVRAMLDVLSAQPGVNGSQLLIIGVELGADAGFLGCALDSRCLASVLLSPQVGADLEAAMADYNPRPVLLAASQEDSASLRAAERVRQAATGPALLQSFEGAGRGTQILLNRPDVVTLIGNFLNEVTGR